MKITDRLYWFFRNFAAFILILITYPLRIVIDLCFLIKVLFNTSGSEVLNWPWDME